MSQSNEIVSGLNSQPKRLKAEAEMVIRGFQANGFPGWAALGLEQARSALSQMASAVAGSSPQIGSVENLTVPSDAETPTEARLYLPAALDPKPPIMVYMHGGGFTVGGLDAVDVVVRRLVDASGCAVLSVGYKLAPENKFPAALTDVENAIRWATENADAHGFDASRLAVGGDSSGANLAAAVAILCRDRKYSPIRLQLLVCPALDCDFETSSYREFGEGTLSALSRRDVEWFISNYGRNEADLKNPYFCPLLAEDLSNLPAALIVSAEIDPLSDDARRYATRLAQSGVSVDLMVHAGMFHNFWRMPGVLQEAQDSIREVGRKIRARL